MAGFKGAGTCNRTLDAWLGSTTLGPDPVYIALFTAAPTAGGGGTECVMTGYARVSVTNNATNFPAAAAGSKATGSLIDFGTLGGSSQTIIGVAVVTTLSGALGANDIIYYGPLSNSRLVTNGDGFEIPIAGGVFTEV